MAGTIAAAAGRATAMLSRVDTKQRYRTAGARKGGLRLPRAQASQQDSDSRCALRLLFGTRSVPGSGLQQKASPFKFVASGCQ